MKDQNEILPNNAELEELVLGAIMLESQAAYTAVSLLKPDAFYGPGASVIFSAIQSLVSEGKEVDIISVTHKLRSIGELQNVGGAAGVSKLTNRVAGTARLEEWVMILEEYAIRRRTIVLCQESEKKARDEMQDIFEVCEGLGNGYVELGHVDPEKLTLSPEKRAEQGLKRIVDAITSGVKPGISTGLDALDKPSGGFQTGLWIIAARPGCGKSELATFITHQVAAQDIPVLSFQCEMSEEQSINREFSKYTNIPYSRMEKANVSGKELDDIARVVDKFKGLPAYLDHTPGITVNRMVSKIKFQHRRNKIRMVIIDYLQIMDIPTPKGGTRDQAIGIVTRKLKQTANQLKIPIILLAQLSRATDQRRPFPIPQQSDLRESGNIENDADAVTFLYYPEKWKNLYTKGFEDENGTPLDGVLMFIWDKNRYGRPGVAEYCRWDSGRVSFRNMNESLDRDFPHPDRFTEQNNAF